MTAFCVLFANVAEGEKPIVISDVLLTDAVRQSFDDRRYGRRYIPSIGGTFPQVSADVSIAGLVQKTCVLGNGHCMVVAGDLRRAARFCSEVASRSAIGDIVEICRRYDGELQFVVLMNDSEGKTVYVCATESCRRLSPGSYGTVLLGGSGEGAWASLFMRHQGLPFKAGQESESLDRALCLVNEALDMDQSNRSETLGKRFGAYYETTAFTGSEFIKVGRVAHHYLTLDFTDNGSWWIIKKSYYHEYLDNDLIIRRISWGLDSEEPAVWQDCYVIGGLMSRVNAIEARRWIDETAPAPLAEVLCVQVGESKFRFVRWQRRLVTIRKEEGKWFPAVDREVIEEISCTIAAEL